MKHCLSKIQFINYKVFENITLTIDNGLNVFSGPNGYGKTSFFDAVEFLITGDIRRIKENTAINGTKSYASLFLARNDKKDVLIKGEFTDTQNPDNKFTIVKLVSPGETNKLNNPKFLKDCTKTILLKSFDDLLEKGEMFESHPVDRIRELLGNNSQTHYQTLYYIEQEDRLNFIKYNEKARVNNLEFLFGIDDELKYSSNLKSALEKLKKISKTLKEQKSSYETAIKGYTQSAMSNQIEYVKILDIDNKWDSEKVTIFTIEERDFVLSELQKIKQLVINIDSFISDNINQSIINLLSKEPELKFYIYSEMAHSNKELYSSWLTAYSFWTNQQKLLEQQKFSELDFKTLIKFVDEKYEVSSLIDNIANLKNIASKSNDSLIELIRLRNELRIAYVQSKNKQSSCPYCGFQWDSIELLDEKFEEEKIKLTTLLDASSNELLAENEKLKEIIGKAYEPAIISNYKLNSENTLFLFYKDNEKEIVKIATSISAQMKSLNILFAFLNEKAETTINNNFERLKALLIEAKKAVPDEYYLENEKHNFTLVYSTYFKNINSVKELKIESVSQKAEYISAKFIESQNERYLELGKIKKLEKFIDDEMAKLITEYKRIYDECLAEYRERIIAAIEIPFFIYSSRILQSYPEGNELYRNGVVLQVDKPTKLTSGIDSIRFVAPGKAHDVLYTMSSGQLSGVILSFTLALYKSFSDEKLCALFIDDPVQSMDELNIMSFVELLKSEFKDVQMVMSTHEETFATYVKYKYSKVDLPAQIIRLSDKIIN